MDNVYWSAGVQKVASEDLASQIKYYYWEDRGHHVRGAQ